MKFNFYETPEKELPKNIYRFTISTMEGDADDYHDFWITVNTEEEAKQLVIYCEVMARQYTESGRGGGYGFYDHLPFFEECFDEKWHYMDGQWMDSWETYDVTYFDNFGVEYECEITLEDKDYKEISTYEVKQ